MKMFLKKDLRCYAVLLLVCLTINLAACNTVTPSVSGPGTTTEANVTDDYVQITFSESNGYTFEGVGTELDPHIFRSFNLKKGVTEEDWELICQRIKAMKLHKIRVCVMPEWHEPQNENNDPMDMDLSAFSWDNEDINSLFMVLDAAEEYGVDVNLTLWGAHFSKRSWLAYPATSDWVSWVSPPNNLDEWSENFCALLKYCFEVKQYTCIKEITSFNEPNGYFDIASYAAKVINLEERLRKEGLRNKVNLCVSDGGDSSYEWLKSCVTNEQLEEISDSFTSHFYRGIETEIAALQQISRQCVDIVAKNGGKTYKCNEFGLTWNDGGDYRDTEANNSFDRGVLEAKMITAFLGEGCVGLTHWCLFDEYYSAGQLMRRGLWKFKSEDWAIRPVYYAIAMITQHTEVGSVMYKGAVEDPNLVSTALQGENGWSYLLANDSKEAKKVVLNNKNEDDGTYNMYLYSSETLPTDGSLALNAVTEVNMNNGAITVEIPANSFVVLSQN